LDIVSSYAAVRVESALTADEMSGLKPVLNVFGDFLEIFSKWYSATVPIAAGFDNKNLA